MSEKSDMHIKNTLIVTSNNHKMVQYDCWSIPGNTEFDRTLAKIGLDRRQIRNVVFEFLGTLLFSFFGGFSSPSSAGSGAWTNGLILAVSFDASATV